MSLEATCGIPTPKSDEALFVLLAADRAAVIAQFEPKEKDGGCFRSSIQGATTPTSSSSSYRGTQKCIWWQ